jgi:multicomponent Na+:H+ antiporter subunit B
MRLAARRVVFGVAGAGLLAVLVTGFSGLPAFGEHVVSAGEHTSRVEPGQRRATNVVTSIVVDYRGFDTLGEESILFAAATGVALLLRPSRRERRLRPEREPPPAVDDVIGFVGRAIAGPIALLGLSLIANGSLTPGGGFQGGAIVASAGIAVMLMIGHRPFERLAPTSALDVLEGFGIAGYAFLGVAGLVVGLSFLENMLPLGRFGSLLSTGFMPLINLCIGVAVAGGLLLVVAEFLEQTLHGGGTE